MAGVNTTSRMSAPMTRLTLLILLYTSAILYLPAACNGIALGALENVDIRSLPTRRARQANADLPHLHPRTDDQASPDPIKDAIHVRDSTSSSSPSVTFDTSVASNAPTPTPFDTSLGSNFTQQSCPTFFGSFLSNSTFKSCDPFSLLLQNSNSFFQASASNLTLNPVLDATCAAPFQTCSPLMASLATQLISSSNCAADYSLGNPLVVQAYRGLLSYAPMYNAACLKADPTGRTSSKNFPYCYTSSLNSTSGADSELYFLPLGLGLPGGTSISCSSCTQQTMAMYASFATDSKSPLNNEYLPAANMINSACGSGFVNASSSITSKTSSTAAPSAAGQIALPNTLLVGATFLAIFGTCWWI